MNTLWIEVVSYRNLYNLPYCLHPQVFLLLLLGWKHHLHLRRNLQPNLMIYLGVFEFQEKFSKQAEAELCQAQHSLS